MMTTDQLIDDIVNAMILLHNHDPAQHRTKEEIIKTVFIYNISFTPDDIEEALPHLSHPKHNTVRQRNKEWQPLFPLIEHELKQRNWLVDKDRITYSHFKQEQRYSTTGYLIYRPCQDIQKMKLKWRQRQLQKDTFYNNIRVQIDNSKY
jgi:hypothetical protein